MTYILFIIGFVLLVKGADFLVDGSVSIAKRFNISNLAIGLTLVAFGTSAPELAVNITSGLKGETDLAIGNIIGSNIANVFLILGVSAVIYPLTVRHNTVWKEIPLSFLAALLVGFMANDVFIEGAGQNVITRIDGLALISFFVIFLYYTFNIAKQGGEMNFESVEKIPISKSVTLIAAGLVGLIVGGKWIVDGAIAIAQYSGISQSIIGLTIVAIGTSLPELATSAVAAYKKHSDIAIGNIVGSNIFNIFWILGLSATINPLPFGAGNNYDIFVMISASLLLFVFLFIGKRNILERWQGALFLVLYFIYLTSLIMR